MHTFTTIEMIFLTMVIGVFMLGIATLINLHHKKTTPVAETEEAKKRREEGIAYTKQLWENKFEAAIASHKASCDAYEKLFLGKDGMDPTADQTNMYLSNKARLAELTAGGVQVFRDSMERLYDYD